MNAMKSPFPAWLWILMVIGLVMTVAQECAFDTGKTARSIDSATPADQGRAGVGAEAEVIRDGRVVPPEEELQH